MPLALYLLALALLLLHLPAELPAAAPALLLPLAAAALWRHGWEALHLARAGWYRAVVFPRWRRQAGLLAAWRSETFGTAPELFVVLGAGGDTATRLAGYDAILGEVASYPGRVTLVAALAEPGERRLLKQYLAVHAGAQAVRLVLVARVSGEAAALARGLRAVARRVPARNALVLVLAAGTVPPLRWLADTAPLLTALPWAAALVTDQDCLAPDAGPWRRARLRLRLAVRQVRLSSLALAGRLPDLDGGMALYRAAVATDPALIADLEASDLPAGQAAAWSLLRHGGGTLYVPDLRALTVVWQQRRTTLLPWDTAARAEARCLALGPRRLGRFLWWSLLERRWSAWTVLVGPLAALVLGLLASPAFLLGYLAWVLATRLLATFLLLTVRPAAHGLWPILLLVEPIRAALRRGRAETGGLAAQLLGLCALTAAIAWVTGTLPLPTAASLAALP
ncbi:MAG: glycosyltransferase [Geminicoccaceae bacterium]